MKKTLFFLLFYVNSCLLYSQLKPQITAFEAEKYLGKYKLETQQFSAEGEISFENGDLYFFTEGIPKVKLLAENELESFKTENYDIFLKFIKNEFHEIVNAEILFQGQKFIAKKL